MRGRRPLHAVLLAGALPLAALAGCQGSLDDAPRGPRGTARTPEPTCTVPTAGASPLRRLTRTEYDYAIEDLLGDTSRPARAFAPDDLTTGFEVGGTVAPLLAEQYLDTAESLAAGVDLASFVDCDPATRGGGALGEDACASAMLERFGRLAFRRAISTAELDSLMQMFRTGRELEGYEVGLRHALAGVLSSPAFLYHVELDPAGAAPGDVVRITGYEMASRLSFLFWRSGPDDALLDAAEAGLLDTEEGVADEARRLLEDERSARGIHDFYRQWLGLDGLATIDRDQERYPGFDRATAASLRTELDAYVDEIMAGEGTLDALFTSSFGMVSADTAAIYGVDAPSTEGLVRRELDPAQRAGLLTHPAILALHGKPNQSDPIHRGVFVRQRVLCMDLPPPPADVDTTPPDPEPGLSTRDRFAAHRQEERCAGCHALIDPIGFGFEHYDAIGRWRDVDDGVAVDATGEVIAGGDASGTFDGAIELSAQLAASETVRSCVARQWMRYATNRVETRDDRCARDAILARFTETGGDLRELLVAIVESSAFTHRQVPEPAGATAP